MPSNRLTTVRATLLAVLAALAAVAATSSPVVQAASANTATSMVIVKANVTGVVKPDAPWAQPPFMVSGELHTATVNFFNDAGPAPLSTGGKGVALTFAIVDGATTNLRTYTVPPNVTTFTVADLPTTAPANNVQLKATAATSKQSPIIAFLGLSILRTYLSNPGGAHALSSIGGTGSGLDASCEATRAEPFCVDVILPPGASASGGNVILALGTCAGVCPTPLSFLELLINVDPTVVTNTNPVRILMKCDKSVCSGDPKDYPAFVQLTPALGEVVSPFCQSKGVIDEGLDFCTDQASSIKNGAGDYVLTLLIRTDPKTRLGI